MIPFVNKIRNCIRLKSYILKITFTKKLNYLILLLLAGSYNAGAQITAPQQPAADTLRTIEIIQGQSLREKTIDSATTLKTIAGNENSLDGLFNAHSKYEKSRRTRAL